jgi:hypothetical protein
MPPGSWLRRFPQGDLGGIWWPEGDLVTRGGALSRISLGPLLGASMVIGS